MQNDNGYARRGAFRSGAAAFEAGDKLSKGPSPHRQFPGFLIPEGSADVGKDLQLNLTVLFRGEDQEHQAARFIRPRGLFPSGIQ